MWSECITWSPGDGKKSNPDKRIHELLESSYAGMGKALSAEPDRVMFPFKHWFWERGRPKAKKQRCLRFGARLLLDPETEEPWILIFDPQEDGEEVIKRGEPEEHRSDGGAPTEPGPELDAGVDAR